MANFTNDKIQTAWKSARTVEGANSSEWRKDACDAWINRKQYGRETDYGWEADHILPTARGGTDHSTNLRTMHWQNNRSKGDDFPEYNASVTSDENKNIEKQERKTVHQDAQARLKALYPNNKYIYKPLNPKIMSKKITPQQNQSNQQNANKGTSGINKQYAQNQGNKGKQMNPNQGGKKK